VSGSRSSAYAREQRIPGAMVLDTVGASTRESPLEHAQASDVIDVEPLPSVRRTAATLAADLKSQQTLHAAPEAVVMGFDNADTSTFVDELDDTLVTDRTHELRIHRSRPNARAAGLLDLTTPRTVWQRCHQLAVGLSPM
jgi:hypothetical protein